MASLVNRLVQRRRSRPVQLVLNLMGVELPGKVAIGSEFTLHHRGMGTVVHPATVIGDRVTIFHQVTIGRVDAHIVPWNESGMQGVRLCDDVVLYPGAKVLGGRGTLTVGRGTIVAANAVLLQSTGEWEVWGGVPARRIGQRDLAGGAPLA